MDEVGGARVVRHSSLIAQVSIMRIDDTRRHRMILKKTALALGLSWMVFSLVAVAQDSPTPKDENAEAAKDVLAEKVPPPGDAIGLLLKQVKEVNWDETPLEDVLEWVRDQGDGRINVVPRWPALNNEGVDAEKGVTLRLTNTTIAEVLNEVLEQLSDEGKLRFQATENKIIISTQAYFDKKLILKVYDIGDILFNVPDFSQEAPQIDLTGQNSQGGGGGGAGGAGGGSGGRSVFAGGGAGGGNTQLGANQQETAQARQELRDMILVSVAPETWADAPQSGGGGATAIGLGRIRIYNRQLVVYNTLEVHEQLAGWFDLRR